MPVCKVAAALGPAAPCSHCVSHSLGPSFTSSLTRRRQQQNSSAAAAHPIHSRFSAFTPRLRKRAAVEELQRSQLCYYATVPHRDDEAGRWRRSSNTSQDTQLPEWPRGLYPTPYEIFGISTSAPYTKKRFYQLVKLYHPDKHEHGDAAVSHLGQKTRLERYRLVVAANDLLSDPEKRRLYDAHGVGWIASKPASTVQESMRQADRAWRDRASSAANNATWEDWERWYEQQQHQYQQTGGQRRQEPLYMSNGMFVSLVVMMCMIGALAQHTRAESMGSQYMEFQTNRHMAVGEDMRRQSVSMAGMNKDERVENFLRDRESGSIADLTSLSANSRQEHEEEEQDRNR